MVQRCTHKCFRNSSTTITTYPICIRIDSPYYLRLFSFPRLSDTDCRAYPSYVPRISSSPLQFHATSDEQPACATNYKSNQRTSSLRTAVYDSKFVQDHSPYVVFGWTGRVGACGELSFILAARTLLQNQADEGCYYCGLTMCSSNLVFYFS